MDRSCCPSYAHRLNVNKFLPTRSQKRALRRLERYLEGGPLYSQPPLKKSNSKSQPHLLKYFLKELIQRWLKLHHLPPISNPVTLQPPSTRQKEFLPVTVFSTSPVCLALFHGFEPVNGRGCPWHSVKDLASQLCSAINQQKDSFFRDLLTEEQQQKWLQIVQAMWVTHSEGYLNFHLPEKTPFREDLAQKLLPLISRDAPVEDFQLFAPREDHSRRSSLPESVTEAVNRRRSFSIDWHPSAFIEEEYSLFEKYQSTVHKDSPTGSATRVGYSSFLVETPFKKGDLSSDPEMGSFHMQYRIDDRLVAVGVVDVLPSSLISVYFFWDPDFAALSLGKISVMKEIQWVQAMHQHFPDLQYLYLGYYVHSCPKANYKANYHPAELLCPETLKWVRLTDSVRQQLNQGGCQSLASIPDALSQPNDVFGDADPWELYPISTQQILVAEEVYIFEMFMKFLDRLVYEEVIQQDDETCYVQSLTKALKAWQGQVLAVGQHLVYEWDGIKNMHP